MGLWANFFKRINNFVAATIALIAIAGCEPLASQATSISLQETASSKTPRTQSPEVNAGIIFKGQASYLCLPLSGLGLNEVTFASDIVAVSTSCECVEASIVSYVHSPSRIENALRLDFVPEQPAANDELLPANLAVEVKFQLNSGSTQSLTVNVLETESP